ncbi:MAG: hypothetical protein J5I98_14705 [Phaeodactylibacter sp.]|nr:hypothetical protein [Phaeodactylibacter sp.]
MEIHGNTWKYMEIYGNTWKYMEIHGNIWKYMEIHGNTWKYMEIYGDGAVFEIFQKIFSTQTLFLIIPLSNETINLDRVIALYSKYNLD